MRALRRAAPGGAASGGALLLQALPAGRRARAAEGSSSQQDADQQASRPAGHRPCSPGAGGSCSPRSRCGRSSSGIKRAQIAVDQQPMLTLIVRVAQPVGLEEQARQRMLTEAQPPAPASGLGERAVGDHQLIAKRRPPQRDHPPPPVLTCVDVESRRSPVGPRQRELLGRAGCGRVVILAAAGAPSRLPPGCSSTARRSPVGSRPHIRRVPQRQQLADPLLDRAHRPAWKERAAPGPARHVAVRLRMLSDTSRVFHSRRTEGVRKLRLWTPARGSSRERASHALSNPRGGNHGPLYGNHRPLCSRRPNARIAVVNGAAFSRACSSVIDAASARRPISHIRRASTATTTMTTNPITSSSTATVGLCSSSDQVPPHPYCGDR